MNRLRDYLSIFVAAPVVALIALAVSLVHTYNEAQALARSQLGEQQLQLARQSVVSFGKTIDLLARELKWLARQPAAIDFDLEAFRAIAEESFRYVKGSYVNDIGLLDAGGVVRLPLVAPHLTGRDFSYREYFKKAAASKRLSPTYELITFKGVDVGEKGIAIAMPILSEGEFRGVVLFTIIVAELVRGLGDSDPVSSRSWVMDSEGNVVFHPSYPTGTKLTELGYPGDSYRDFLRMAMLGRSGKAVYLSPEGKETIASYHPIAIADEMCSFVVATDEDVARGLLASFTADYAVLTTAAFLVVLAGSVAVLWRVSKWNRDLESTVSKRTADLERYQSQLQSLAAELFKTEGRERRRIAAELHDRIGQSLAVVSFRLAALRRMVPEHAKRLGEARSLLRKTIEDTRSLTFELSPPILYELGLEAAVRWLAEEIGEQHDIAFEVEANGRAEPLAADLSDLLFQAVRELLVNVVKHSRAERARIGLERVDGNLRITVADDGAGFDPAAAEARRGKEGGFGLFSIRERLVYSGGRLEILSRPGCGTRATLVAPLGRRPAETKGGA